MRERRRSGARPSRRRVLRCAAALLAVVACTGHTPYRQWQVYRRRHLLVGTSREDAPSYALGKRVAELLARELPESRARVTRAPTVARLADLLASDQIRVVLITEADARDLASGRGVAAGSGPQPVRILYRIGGRVLVCRADFPAHHAWLVVSTLVANGDALPDASPPADAPALPVHPGALAALDGAPQPPAPPDGAPADPPHEH